MVMPNGEPAMTAAAPPFRILSLDGGGAKGFYTLGVLRELEAMVNRPLHTRFDLIFGTSTGAIIAGLLALGRSVDEIHALYKEHVPTIMRSRTASGRSAALAQLALTVFSTKTFADVLTGIGIVATRWEFERPMIFKGNVAQAHGRRATFAPGFGCTIADAVRASCSAYPFFKKVVLTTNDGNHVELLDGGYCANNPTLYAIADAVKALGHEQTNLRVVSIGVGVYPEPSSWRSWFKRRFRALQLLQKTLNVNTTSMEQLRVIMFGETPTVRINDTFERPEMATDLLESDLTKLNMLYQRGGESFATHETALRRLLDAPAQATVVAERTLG
ncbi:MAG: patatin-like phospholipase family protein [Gammaproteobacteria bacterium]|nr:patatin-like phospholipase family protein [Gammaproteobacteria bacterium]